ncbi:MAG: phenylpyruvate tautomerase MIF-related protein [Methylococcales bacterium]
MPYFKFSTNVSMSESDKKEFLKQASDAISQLLAKPERYVFVEIISDQSLSMSGSTEPAAYIELKSIGLPEKDTAGFSADICDLIKQTVGIDPERIYIEFINIPRHLWGWNSGTF